MSCCTSDIRVKQGVINVLPQDDLQTVLSFPRRVAFAYTNEYKETNTHFSRNLTYNGFIAQELESDFPTLVTKSPHPVKLKNGKVIDSLLSVDLNQAVPYLVGAIQALYEEQQQLKRIISKQAKYIAKLKKNKKR
jgi:hypothetical protein